MTADSILQRAKAGEADAIASLLAQALAQQGVTTVVGERQAYCLELLVEGRPLPDQNVVVAVIRQGLQRLRVDSIGVVQIRCTLTGQPAIGWDEEFALLGTLGDHVATTDTSSSARTNPVAKGKKFSAPNNVVSQVALDQAYMALGLETGATIQDVDEAYFRLRAELLRQGRRDAVAEFKQAHGLLKQHLQQVKESLAAIAPVLDSASDGVEALIRLMRSQGIEGKARIKDGKLQIRLEPGSSRDPNRASATLYNLLDQEDPAALGLAPITQIEVFGMASAQKVGWKRLVPMPPPEASDDTDALSFNNRYVSAIAFPVLLLCGMAMSALPLANFLLFGVKVWFHEFGHAIVAWLAGRRAIPLPIGWTNVGEHRSLVVYFGLLMLLGLLFWAGRREGKRWPMVLAGVLVVIQFWFTWLMPEHRYETLLSFGGIGGEFLLCTLLMVSFFFPLPDYWRWDFYRYPVILGAAFTFWGQYGLWQQISRGLAPIPWGSLWGGEAHGDMNNLRLAGWSDQQIIDAYTTLGNVCLLILVGVYLYFAVRQNRHHLFALSQRWLANH
jgi:hypothetical protein